MMHSSTAIKISCSHQEQAGLHIKKLSRHGLQPGAGTQRKPEGIHNQTVAAALELRCLAT